MNYIEKNSVKIIILGSIYFLLVSLHFFFVSIHNIDIAQNSLRMERLIYDTTGQNIELKELDVNLNEQQLLELYLQGLKWSIYSIYLLIASSILLGYGLSKVKT